MPNKSRTCGIVTVVLLACSFSPLSAQHLPSSHPADESRPYGGNKPERVQWLQDAGFGMFVHWSLDSQLGSVISHSLVGASDDYIRRFIEDLPKTFNPKHFDPEEIATLARLAGMKYVVLTAKHHSGFCLWDTKTTDFNIMNTPYGHDILAEYVAAVRKVGLAVGFYYSPEDFYYLHRAGRMITRRGPHSNPAEDPDYVKLIQEQCRELMSNYGPVNVMFFDGQGGDIAKDACWAIQPDLLVTRGALATPEQTVPGAAAEEAWEACVTMGTQWQYKPTNDEYKSGSRLIELLIEARAKNGALLLNVGPKPDGTLPIEQEERLREVALWRFINHEAIDGVRPWVVTHEDNIWFTRKAGQDTVYAIVTDLPGWSKGRRKEFVLASIEATAKTKVDVLGQSSKWIEYDLDGDAACRFEQKDDGLHVSVVRAQRIYNNSQWPNPIVIRLQGVKPALQPPTIQTSRPTDVRDGSATFRAELTSLGDADKVQVGFSWRPYAGFVEELYNDKWDTTELLERTETGKCEIPVKLEPGQTYQYRAIVKHPRITMYGDIQRFTAK